MNYLTRGTANASLTLRGGPPAFGSGGAVGPVQIITYAASFTAVVAQAIFAGQAPSDAFPFGVGGTGNYQSSAGTIASATRQASVNGGAWTGTLTGARDPADTVAIRVRVVDSAANERFFPNETGSIVTAQALPVPVVNAIPSIAGQGFSGQTQTATEATWAAIPGTPAGMARETEVRWTRNDTAVGTGTTIAPTNAQIGEVLRREGRARHTLAGKASAWSDWSQSAPLTIQALPVPVNVSPPVINNPPARVAKQMGQNGAVWAAPPAQPAGMGQEYGAEWQANGATFSSAVTSPALTEEQNNQTLTRRARSRFTLGGQEGAWSDWAVSSGLTITYNAPATSGTVADQGFLPDVAITPLDLKTYFTVSGDADLSGLTFALAPGSDALPTGLSLSSVGVLSGTPTVEVVRNIIVRATNSGGTADQSFEIEVAAVVIPATNYARSYTENIGSIIIDLSTIGPAESGAATYATIGSLPTGVTRSGDELTIATATAVSGTATVRRTDSNGDRDLVLTLTMVAGTLTAEGGDNYAFTSGDDDPGATEYVLTPTGGPLSGQPITFTRSALNALATNAALLVTGPVIGFDVDAGTPNELDEGDVLDLVQGAVRVHRAGETPASSSYQWRDAAGAIAGATAITYTGTGDEDTTVFLRETVGAATADSATVPAVPSAPPATAPAAFTAGQWTLQATDLTITALPGDGGSAITDLEYRIGAGAAVSLSATTTGTYAHAGAETNDIQIRAVNAIGAGDWSDTKAVPAAAALEVAYLGTSRVASGDDLTFDEAGQTVLNVPIGNAADRDGVLIYASSIAFGTPAGTATLGGSAGTLLASQLTDGLASSRFWWFPSVTGDSPVTFSQTLAGTIVVGLHVAAYRIKGAHTINAVTDYVTSGALTVNQSVQAGDWIVAGGISGEAGTGMEDTGNFTTVGMTENVDRRTHPPDEGSGSVAAIHECTTTETRTLTFTASGGATRSAISLRIRPA